MTQSQPQSQALQPQPPPQAEQQPPAKPKRWRAVLRLVLAGVALALIAWYVAAHWSEFRDTLTHLGGWSIAGAAALDVMLYLSGAWAIQAAVGVFGVHPRLGEAWHLSVFTRFCNMLTPFRGGIFARAIYLKGVYGLPYEHFVAGLSAQFVTTVAASVAFALAGLLAIYAMTGHTIWPAVAVLGGVLAATLAVAVIRPRMQERGGPVRVRLARLFNGWREVAGSSRAMAVLAVSAGAYLLSMSGILAVLLWDMGRPASLPALVVITALGNISTIFQVTPGNIGVYEAAVAAVGLLVGISAADVLAATLAWRVIDALVVLAGGSVAGHVLAKSGLKLRQTAAEP